MELCINELTLAKQGTLLEHIKESALAGFKSIELSKGCLFKYLRSGGTIAELKNALKQNNIKVASLNALDRLTFNSKADIALLKEEAFLLMYIAKELDCHTMEVIASFNVGEKTWEEIRDNTVESLKTFGKIAAEYDINLSLEFMSTPGSSINSFEKCLEVLTLANEPNVGMLLDTWHFYVCGAKPSDILKMDGSMIKSIHISDVPQCDPYGIPRTESYFAGNGIIPIREILSNAKKIGYSGIVSLEAMSPTILDQPLTAILNQAYKTTKACL